MHELQLFRFARVSLLPSLLLLWGCSGGGNGLPGGTGGSVTASGGSVQGSGGATSSGGQSTTGGSGGGATGGTHAGTGGTTTSTGGAAGSGGSIESGGAAGSAGAGGDACPASVPETGDSCRTGDLRCLYQDCATFGRAVATCNGTEFSVEKSACTATSCGGDTCSGEELCAIQSGGAYLGMCTEGTCGTGPITCECLDPNCLTDCSVQGTADSGFRSVCNTCPDGLACP